ncbi:MAG TPA: type I 3-dehydroquinate dehydratase [Bacteroidota bacterium]|jgi:3-dehydroquinate dehydratase/shikimate dehydrogenase|nr:type I 3-dehydroquinate dehydratase [Bacteroidota bacterium]
MKLCLSIAPQSMDEAIAMLKSVDKSVELVEIRIDGLHGLDLEELLKRRRPKVIITNRRSQEGGAFTGSAAEQIDILSQASRLGAEFLDIEISWGFDHVRELMQKSRKSSVIVSYHNFVETPADLMSIYRKIRSTNAYVVKIATHAASIDDNTRIFELCDAARRDRQRIVALCMGERGEISRILGAKYGSFLTFGSASALESTAPGQRTVEDLQKVFRIHTLASRTKVFGLIGNPVSQSEGIYFHNRIFARESANAVYVNFLVDNLAAFMISFREMIAGASVTMPFKEEIMTQIDNISETAATVHAVNTLVRRRGKLHGHNTDFPAMSALFQERMKLKGKNVIVLGTGGTAKTMAFAALTHGARTTILGRSMEKAESLGKLLGCSYAALEHLPDLPCDILMNGTSVGMAGVSSPGPDQSPVHPNFFRKKRIVVFDAVYNPPMTQLLRDAKAFHCETISGVELFQRQAQLQSKLFLESL